VAERTVHGENKVMVDYDRFAALCLSSIFPAQYLESYPYYVAAKPGGGFDTEYQGGQWHEELIDGVQFFYPAMAGNKLGIIELWGAGCTMAAAVRDRPDAVPPFFVPGWTANVNRVLEALELPIRMGFDEVAVRSLAGGRVHASAYPNEWYDSRKDVTRGTLTALSFACRAPSVYHMQAVVHATEGLLSFAVRRPDLIRANESDKGGYDRCFGWLFGEG
jgi:hypothetical protein